MKHGIKVIIETFQSKTLKNIIKYNALSTSFTSKWKVEKKKIYQADLSAPKFWGLHNENRNLFKNKTQLTSRYLTLSQGCTKTLVFH